LLLMSAKLLSRLAARAEETTTSGSTTDSSNKNLASTNPHDPVVTAEPDLYAHSYYAAIKGMGLPMLSPNANSRQKYVEQSATPRQLPSTESEYIDQASADIAPTNACEIIADTNYQPVSSNKAVVNSKKQHRGRKNSSSKSTSSCKESNGRNGSSGIENIKSKKQTSGSAIPPAPAAQRSTAHRPSTTTAAGTTRSRDKYRGRSTSPVTVRTQQHKRLASPTASSSKRFHTPEGVQQRENSSPGPGGRFHDGDEWRKLTDWLDNLKYKKYMGLFRRSGITSLKLMQNLTISDLADIGVTSNDIPILKLKISEIMHQFRRQSLQHSRSSGARGGIAAANTSSSSSDDDADNHERLDPRWSNTSTRMSDSEVAHDEDRGREQFMSSLDPDPDIFNSNRPRYGSPDGMTSTVAGARAGIPQNFFETHGRVVRIPPKVKTLRPIRMCHHLLLSPAQSSIGRLTRK
jgi:hypothetical protein